MDSPIDRESPDIVKLFVDGITCHSCEAVIRNSLRNVSGIEKIEVDIEQKLVFISGNPSLGECVEEIETFGFSITILSRGGPHTTQTDSPEKKKDEEKKEKKETPTLRKGDELIIIEQYITKSDFLVQGMTCASCVSLIEIMMKQVDGIHLISVNLLGNRASITYDYSKIGVKEICDLITDLGYKTTEIVGSRPGSLVVQILELTKTNTNEIIDTIEAIPGVFQVTVEDCTTHEDHMVANIKFEPTLKARDIIRKINETAFSAIYHPSNTSIDALNRKKEITYYRNMTISSFVFAIPSMLLMILDFIPSVSHALMKNIVPGLSYMDLTLWILATPVQFWIGKSFYINSYKSCMELRPNMDVLIMLGTTVAYFSSAIGIIYAMIYTDFQDIPMFFETAVFLIAFVMLGRYLENNAKAKTSDAITKLFELQATEATLLIYDEAGVLFKEEIIDPNLIELGDKLKVKPGEKIPCDGKVISGKSTCNEAMITGESMPIKKIGGTNVIGGSINGHGVLVIEATKISGDTALAQIIKLVEDAQCSKGETQKLADTISGFFVPVVIVLSLITFLIWDILGGSGVIPYHWFPPGQGPISFALLFGISVMVIACPCALGLATPTAVMVGTGLAADFHILMKGGEVLDKAQNITNVLFDKTGTLTIGRPEVTDFNITKEGISEMTFWSMIGSAEADSEHPLGKCIYKYAKKKNASIKTVNKFKAISGMGIRCEYEGKSLFLGNRKLMNEQKFIVPKDISEQMDTFEFQGKTAMILACDEIIGFLAVSDPIRPEAAWVINQLKEKNIGITVISGDNQKTVNYIAKQLNIDRIFAEVLPKDKKDKVEILQHEGHIVAMVGDGINDSPALAQSDVGFAIGAGSDVAIESAGIVLMRSNLVDIITAIDLAQTTSRRIKLNFFWAFLYNCAAIPIAAGLFFPIWKVPLPPWIAGVAMALSSVSVVSSSLTLKWYKPPSIPSRLNHFGEKDEVDDQEILLSESL